MSFDKIPFLSDSFSELPEDSAILDYLLQKQLQVTDLMANVVSVDPSKIDDLKSLSAQVLKAVETLEKVIRLRPTRETSQEASTDALDASFTYPDTNYQSLGTAPLEAILGGSNDV